MVAMPTMPDVSLFRTNENGMVEMHLSPNEAEMIIKALDVVKLSLYEKMGPPNPEISEEDKKLQMELLTIAYSYETLRERIVSSLVEGPEPGTLLL